MNSFRNELDAGQSEMHTSPCPSALPDDELLGEALRLAVGERQATAALVRVLAEVDVRRLYLREGCASLFAWCVQVLGLEEGAAYNRIEVARAAQRFPLLLDALDRGDVSLTAVRLLAPHLTPANHVQMIGRASQLTKRDVQLLVAELAPRPEVADSIRKLTPTTPPPRSAACDVLVPPPTASPTPSPQTGLPAPATPGPAETATTAAGGTVALPLSPTRFRLHVTIPTETHAKLRLAQDLLRHTVPDGDVAEVLDRALTVLIRQLERQRFAATTMPRPPRAMARMTSEPSRHIPASVRRAVWKRDGGQCAFVGRHGRCRERGWLEFHHSTPYAAGGAASVENISLRCRAHNAYEAVLFFGPDATSRANRGSAERNGASAASGPSG